MRRHIALMAITTVAVATMSFGSAPAGEYLVATSMLQAAFAKGTLQGGGYAEISLAKIQGGRFSGPGHVLPQSGVPEAPFLYGSSLPPTGNEGPPKYVGCITFRNIKRQTDGGCSIVSPTSATFDTALRSGAVSFSVKSKLTGYFVSATAYFSATTPPTPTQAATTTVNGKQVSQYTVTANGTPMIIQTAAKVSYVRTATLIGSVRSDILKGGGPFKRVDKAELSGGIDASVFVNRARPACTNKSKPGEMPTDGSPPSVPPTPKPPTFDPSKPMPSLPIPDAKICPNDL